MAKKEGCKSSERKSQMKLGALFSGSGGFELAGQLVGFTPVWASEIEPFPILVTTKRFPRMLHLGDIKKLDGAKMTKVDIITGGSPCQDKRKRKRLTIKLESGCKILKVIQPNIRCGETE